MDWIPHFQTTYKVDSLDQKAVELAVDLHDLSLLSLVLSLDHLDLYLIHAPKREYSVSTNNIPGTNGIGMINLSLELDIHPVLDDRMNHSLGILHDNFWHLPSIEWKYLL